MRNVLFRHSRFIHGYMWHDEFIHQESGVFLKNFELGGWVIIHNRT
jgi:hypothetical protein